MNTVDLARRKEAMHALNPFAPGAGRQPKELVGREQELEIMDRIIARTKAGYSDRGLVYSGLRGVGKTVLLLRMKDMAAGQGLITVRMEATGNETHDYELLFDGISKAILRERRGTLRQKMLDSLKHVNEVSLELGLIKTSIGLGNEDKGISSDSLRLEMMVEELCRELKKEAIGPVPVHRRVPSDVQRPDGHHHRTAAQHGTGRTCPSTSSRRDCPTFPACLPNHAPTPNACSSTSESDGSPKTRPGNASKRPSAKSMCDSTTMP